MAHRPEVRETASLLGRAGLTRRETARILGVCETSVWRWEGGSKQLPRWASCWRCCGAGPPDLAAYGYLLGQYLGDGHIAKMGRSKVLRVYCCDSYPEVAGEVESAMRTLLPNPTHRAQKVRRLPSGTRHYGYPRYFFSNSSADIRRILTDALDLIGVAWRCNNPNSVSIAKRTAVAALDEFVGPKH